MANSGRPRTLDDAKRREIYALLTAGYSMPAAADYVNCSRRTIKREVKRNREFADRCRRASINGQLDAVGTLRQAARNDWRAAAWYLERTNPDRFSKRNPALVRPEDVLEELQTVTDHMLKEVKDDVTRDRILQRMMIACGLIQKAVLDHERSHRTSKPVPIKGVSDPERAERPPSEQLAMLLQELIRLDEAKAQESNE